MLLFLLLTCCYTTEAVDPVPLPPSQIELHKESQRVSYGALKGIIVKTEKPHTKLYLWIAPELSEHIRACALERLSDNSFALVIDAQSPKSDALSYMESITKKERRKIHTEEIDCP